MVGLVLCWPEIFSIIQSLTVRWEPGPAVAVCSAQLDCEASSLPADLRHTKIENNNNAVLSWSARCPTLR